jgi:site-specific recombinase XerD
MPKLITLKELPARADLNPVNSYLASLSPGSRRSVINALKQIANYLYQGECGDIREFPWHEMTFQYVSAVQSFLASNYKPTVARKMMSHLRQTLKHCKRLELMDANDYLKAIDLDPVKGECLPTGRYIKREEIQVLRQICEEDTSAFGIRDLAILWVLRAGLRRSEVSKLALSDFSPAENSLHIRHAKGNKERIIYLPEEAIASIEKWVAIRGSQPGFLFHPVSPAQRVLCDRQLNDQSLRAMLLKRGKQAGLESFAPHDFRRTAISDLLEAGVDIGTIQKISGHADTKTVLKYDRRLEEAKKRAAVHLSI